MSDNDGLRARLLATVEYFAGDEAEGRICPTDCCDYDLTVGDLRAIEALLAQPETTALTEEVRDKLSDVLDSFASAVEKRVGHRWVGCCSYGHCVADGVLEVAKNDALDKLAALLHGQPVVSGLPEPTASPEWVRGERDGAENLARFVIRIIDGGDDVNCVVSNPVVEQMRVRLFERLRGAGLPVEPSEDASDVLPLAASPDEFARDEAFHAAMDQARVDEVFKRLDVALKAGPVAVHEDEDGDRVDDSYANGYAAAAWYISDGGPDPVRAVDRGAVPNDNTEGGDTDDHRRSHHRTDTSRGGSVAGECPPAERTGVESREGERSELGGAVPNQVREANSGAGAPLNVASSGGDQMQSPSRAENPSVANPERLDGSNPSFASAPSGGDAPRTEPAPKHCFDADSMVCHVCGTAYDDREASACWRLTTTPIPVSEAAVPVSPARSAEIESNVARRRAFQREPETTLEKRADEYVVTHSYWKAGAAGGDCAKCTECSAMWRIFMDAQQPHEATCSVGLVDALLNTLLHWRPVPGDAVSEGAEHQGPTQGGESPTDGCASASGDAVDV